MERNLVTGRGEAPTDPCPGEFIPRVRRARLPLALPARSRYPGFLRISCPFLLRPRDSWTLPISEYAPRAGRAFPSNT